MSKHEPPAFNEHESLYPSLLAPLTLAGKRLRNRLVHASMTTLMGENARVTPRLIQYHANRARGGAALIVTEPLSMAPHQKLANKVRVWNDDNVEGLKRWADAVESHDCRLLGQVQDPGRGRHAPGRNPDAVGASALPDGISWTVPHALTTGEVRRLIEDFAQSALRLKRCGFSGVEISAGHGHLFHQFLSPWSNARDDDYGGDLEGRTRLLRELIEALRATCGTDFIVGVKLPGNDGVPGSIGPEEAARIAKRVTSAGNVDYVCFAQGSHARSLELHVPDGFGPRAPYMPLIRELRKAVNGVPVVALGRITDPAEADHIIESGDAELDRARAPARDRSRVARESGARPRERDPLLRLVQHVLGHDRHAASADRVRQQSARGRGRRGRLVALARACAQTRRGRRRRCGRAWRPRGSRRRADIT